MRVKNVCVLGGGGFIGRYLASRLTEREIQVHIPSRHSYRHRDLQVLPKVDMEDADVHDPATLERLFKDRDAVINLIGLLNEKGNDGTGFRFAHVELAEKVVNACRKTGVPQLLHMSGLHADAERGPSFYLKTKGEAEDLVHSAADAGLAVTSFRPSVVFGPGDSFLTRFAGLLKFTPGVFPLAKPDARFAPVFAGDVTDAFVDALGDFDRSGERVDLCGPHSYTLKELVQYTARLVGVRRYIWGLPDSLGHLQAQVFERVPGKPLSLDNYASLSWDSVCPEGTTLCPTPLESIAPQYIGRGRSRDRYTDYRAQRGDRP